MHSCLTHDGGGGVLRLPPSAYGSISFSGSWKPPHVPKVFQHAQAGGLEAERTLSPDPTHPPPRGGTTDPGECSTDTRQVGPRSDYSPDHLMQVAPTFFVFVFFLNGKENRTLSTSPLRASTCCKHSQVPHEHTASRARTPWRQPWHRRGSHGFSSLLSRRGRHGHGVASWAGAHS